MKNKVGEFPILDRKDARTYLKRAGRQSKGGVGGDGVKYTERGKKICRRRERGELGGGDTGSVVKQ